MRDLPGVAAESHVAIKRCRPKPYRAIFIAPFQGLPKPDVVAPVRAFADRLFEGEILPPAVVIKIANRRILVWPAQNDAADDLDA
jgi:hypothetical protein